MAVRQRHSKQAQGQSSKGESSKGEGVRSGARDEGDGYHHHGGRPSPPLFGNELVPFPGGVKRRSEVKQDPKPFMSMPGTSTNWITRLKNMSNISSFEGWRNLTKPYKNQPLYRAALGPKDVCVVNDVSLLSEMLVNTQNYTYLYKGNSQKALLGPIMGNGMIIADGAEWHTNRELYTPAFYASFLETQHEKIMYTADKLFLKWDSIIAANPNPPWNEVPMYQHMQRFMADTMGRVLLSEDFNLLAEGSTLGNALWATDTLAGRRKLYSLLPILEYANYFNPKDISFRKNNEFFKKQILEICERRLANRSAIPHDVLGKEILRGGSAQTLADEILGYLYSSIDTTGDLITWALYNLLRNKEHLRKIYAELRSHSLIDVPDPNELTWESVERLEYLQQVVYESSRLYPIAPLLVRQPTEPIVVNGYEIPAGTGIFIPTFMLQTDERYWKAPFEFIPNRFAPENYPDIIPFSYFAFGGVDRGCMARELAMHITKTIIVRVLQRYKLSLVPGYEIVPTLDATMNPSDEAWMLVADRRQSIPERLPGSTDGIDRGEHLRRMRTTFEYTTTPDGDIAERLGNAAIPPYIRDFKKSLFYSDYYADAAQGAHWNYETIELVRIIGMVIWARVIYKSQAHVIRIVKKLNYELRKLIGLEGQSEDLRKWLEVNYGQNLDNYLIPVENVHFWSFDDRTFAYLKLAGVNPTIIRRVVMDGENSDVTDDELREVLERARDSNIDKVPQDSQRVGVGNLFICDYSPLSLVVKNQLLVPNRFLGAPKCYFVLDYRQELQPVAIRFSDDDCIFTPDSDRRLWLYAKIHAQTADNHYHQFISHLCWTHLICEPFAIATMRHLHPTHPINMLLAPHMAKNIQIDVGAREILIKQKGLIDRSLSAGRVGGYALVSQAFVDFSFDHMSLPKLLEMRGLTSKDVLPYYPYREDAVLLWASINAFVAHIVAVYYHDDNSVANDTEINLWVQELYDQFAAARHGKALEHFPSELTKKADLVEVLTRLVYTATAQHSIMNYGLVANYSFVPNSPTMLHAPPPTRETSAELITKKYLAKALPTYDECFNQIGTAHVLADPALPSQTLGGANLRKVYQFGHPAAKAAVKLFERELDAISDKVDAHIRDQLTRYSLAYYWLHPDKVALNVRI